MGIDGPPGQQGPTPGQQGLTPGQQGPTPGQQGPEGPCGTPGQQEPGGGLSIVVKFCKYFRAPYI